MLLLSQDIFPAHLKMERFYGVWSSEKAILKYEKISDRFISLEVIDTVFFPSEKLSMELFLEATSRLYISNYILSYSHGLNLLFRQDYISKNFHSGIGLFEYYKYIDPKFIVLNPIHEIEYPIDPEKDPRSYEIIFQNSNLLCFLYGKKDGVDEVKYYRSNSYPKSEYIHSLVQKSLFYQAVIAKDGLKSPYTGLRERYRDKNEIDSKIISDIEKITNFISAFRGKWSYTKISNAKTYSFEVVNKYGASSGWFHNGFLPEEDKIFGDYGFIPSECLSHQLDRCIFPLQFISYDPKSNRIALNRNYQFVHKDLKMFSVNELRLRLVSEPLYDFDGRSLLFLDENGLERLKWGIDINYKEIREYHKVNGKWVLFSVLKMEN